MSNLKCPHCGALLTRLDELDLNGDEDTTEATCRECDKPFDVTMHIDVRYTVDFIDPAGDPPV